MRRCPFGFDCGVKLFLHLSKDLIYFFYCLCRILKAVWMSSLHASRSLLHCLAWILFVERQALPCSHLWVCVHVLCTCTHTSSFCCSHNNNLFSVSPPVRKIKHLEDKWGTEGFRDQTHHEKAKPTKSYSSVFNPFLDGVHSRLG